MGETVLGIFESASRTCVPPGPTGSMGPCSVRPT